MRQNDTVAVDALLSDGERIDYAAATVFVSETEGVIDGVLCGRLVWQIEPLRVTGGTARRSRNALMLYRAMEEFIASRILNPHGPRWFLLMTRRRGVKAWADRLGWFRQYKGGAIFTKHLP